MHDLLVIGAGISGLTAALTAAQEGMQVRVVAKGMGALHWSAGTIDVMGYTSAGDVVEQPLEAIGQLEQPHPYAVLGADTVREALTWFREVTAASGLPYSGSADDDTNIWLPSPAGAKRPTYLAPEAQRACDLSSDKPIVVVGLDGMHDLYPELIAANLAKQGVPVRSAHLPVDVITDRIDFNSVQLAKELEQEAVLTKFGKQLAKLVQPGERIGLPALVGFDRHGETMKLLSELAGTELFEIPTLPRSVPGIRLHRALVSRLNELNVRVEIGMEVIGFHAEKGVIRWVETETSSRPLRHRAKRYLLATGGILGGGFSSDIGGNLWETIFGIPLTKPDDRSKWFRTDFLDPRGQPVFQAGVTVDHSFQPIDENGEVAYANLWCAGGMLAHSDPIRERSLEGLSLASGRAAAKEIISDSSRQIAPA